jgi:alkylation response protein AidB-like acyl-CoA dehydrogenase
MSACESALTLARSRTQGGKPLIEQQTVQLKIGRMNMLTEALRSYVMRVAWEHDRKLPSTNAGFVMNFSTDVIQEVTQLNMELHGASGFTMDAHANKLVRDGIIWTHLAGDNVQRMKVVRRMAKATK